MRFFGRLTFAAGSVVAAAVLSLSGVAGAAKAAPVHTSTHTLSTSAKSAAFPNTTIFKNVHTGRCMDDSGAGLRAFPCNGLSFQRWTVWVGGGGRWQEWQNQNTLKMLDDSYLGLRAMPNNDSIYQGWKQYTPNPYTNIGIFKSAATGLCLDDSAAGLRAIRCNNLNFQEWRMYS